MAARSAKSVPPAPVGRRGEREAGIVEVAARLYAARGYERVSMADVALAAGLSEGTLYNYFRDKSDLVLNVALASLDRNIAEAERIAATASSLERGLEDLIAHQLRSMLAAPEIYRIWLREVKGAEGYRGSSARAALRRFSGQFSAFLDRWHPAQGRPESIDRSVMRDMLYGGIEQIGWTVAVQGSKRRFDVEATARKLAHAYLAAFGVVSKTKGRTVAKSRSLPPRKPAPRAIS